MNSGLIAKRYALALEQYAESQGQSESCLKDAKRLMQVLPQLDEYLRQPLPDKEKDELLCKVFPDMGEVFHRFLLLVLAHHRESYLRRILQSYMAEYKARRGIADARLTVAADPSEALLERLKKLTIEGTGAKSVDIEVTIDPEIIGGFVYMVNDRRLDASVRRQINDLKKAFETKNKRII